MRRSSTFIRNGWLSYHNPMAMVRIYLQWLISTIFVNLMNMKKAVFKALAKLNKRLLPRYSKRDINNLSKVDKALVAYRYWVTIHALD